VKTRVGVVSLGCSKNLVDTEVMLGHLHAEGATFVTDPEEAEVLLVNTCAFIGEAREESVRAILDAAQLKKTGKLRRLVVAGCMVQRYRDELRESLPEVDAFLGLDELHKVTTAVRSDLPLFTAKAAPAATYLYGAETPRRLSTPPWSAYVKIAEGCDHTCTFCAIPSFRGTFRSRTPDSVAAEAEALARRGVREINLIAQDSSHYGRDRGDRAGLPGLLRRLNAVPDLRWIRVHYLYPNTVTGELIDTMAALPRVVDYVDLPLQHAHPEVLSRMRRGGSAESHLRLLARFRAAMPQGALRTTLIVGFPGESEAEFAALLDFVGEARFDHLGVFAYSHEEGTGAFVLPDDVPDAVKQERRARLLTAQQEIVAERLRSRVGEEVEVLVEGAHPDTDHLLVGRLSTQAPDVDGTVLLNDGPALPSGTFARAELTDVAGYDLVGTILHAA